MSNSIFGSKKLKNWVWALSQGGLIAHKHQSEWFHLVEGFLYREFCHKREGLKTDRALALVDLIRDELSDSLAPLEEMALGEFQSVSAMAPS